MGLFRVKAWAWKYTNYNMIIKCNWSNRIWLDLSPFPWSIWQKHEMGCNQISKNLPLIRASWILSYMHNKIKCPIKCLSSSSFKSPFHTKRKPFLSELICCPAWESGKKIVLFHARMKRRFSLFSLPVNSDTRLMDFFL